MPKKDKLWFEDVKHDMYIFTESDIIATLNLLERQNDPMYKRIFDRIMLQRVKL